VVYQNKICGFLLQVLKALFTFPLNCVSKNVLIFYKTSLMGSPKFLHHDSKPKKIQNLN